jgi:hypothetical protein
MGEGDENGREDENDQAEFDGAGGLNENGGRLDHDALAGEYRKVPTEYNTDNQAAQPKKWKFWIYRKGKCGEANTWSPYSVDGPQDWPTLAAEVWKGIDTDLDQSHRVYRWFGKRDHHREVHQEMKNSDDFNHTLDEFKLHSELRESMKKKKAQMYVRAWERADERADGEAEDPSDFFSWRANRN